jgi:hypothetical protein
MKWEVCVKSTFLSLPSWKDGRYIKKLSSEYLCIPSRSISPDNREYAVVPTILLEYPKGPSDEKCLGPTNPLIRPWGLCSISFSGMFLLHESIPCYIWRLEGRAMIQAVSRRPYSFIVCALDSYYLDETRLQRFKSQLQCVSCFVQIRTISFQLCSLFYCIEQSFWKANSTLR